MQHSEDRVLLNSRLDSSATCPCRPGCCRHHVQALFQCQRGTRDLAECRAHAAGGAAGLPQRRAAAGLAAAGRAAPAAAPLLHRLVTARAPGRGGPRRSALIAHALLQTSACTLHQPKVQAFYIRCALFQLCTKPACIASHQNRAQQSFDFVMIHILGVILLHAMR